MNIDSRFKPVSGPSHYNHYYDKREESGLRWRAMERERESGDSQSLKKQMINDGDGNHSSSAHLSARPSVGCIIASVELLGSFFTWRSVINRPPAVAMEIPLIGAREFHWGGKRESYMRSLAQQ